MSAETLIHVVGDTRPVYTFRLVRGRKAVNLTGATVTADLKKNGGATTTGISCTVTDAAGGVVTLTLTAAHADTAGAGTLEIKVVDAESGIQHLVYPVDIYFRALHEEYP